MTFVRMARRELAIYDSKVHDPGMVRLLKERAAKGVKIRVIGAVKKGDDSIEVRPLKSARLHVRAIVRDGTRAFVGSQSLKKEELDSRREVGVLVTNPAVTRKLMQVFEQDWADSASKEEKKEEKKLEEKNGKEEKKDESKKETAIA